MSAITSRVPLFDQVLDDQGRVSKIWLNYFLSLANQANSGFVQSVQGVANQIVISGTPTIPIIGIASNYAGQASINTLGTITSGVWHGSVISVPYGGTGANSLTSNAVLYGAGTSPINALSPNASATNKFLTQVSGGAPAWNAIQPSDLPGVFTGFADPTAQIGLSVVNGSANTAMRSDAAPPLSQSIAPTWTGVHNWHPVASADSIVIKNASSSNVTPYSEDYWSGLGGGLDFGASISSPPSGSDSTAWAIRSITNIAGLHVEMAFNYENGNTVGLSDYLALSGIGIAPRGYVPASAPNAQSAIVSARGAWAMNLTAGDQKAFIGRNNNPAYSTGLVDLSYYPNNKITIDVSSDLGLNTYNVTVRLQIPSASVDHTEVLTIDNDNLGTNGYLVLSGPYTHTSNDIFDVQFLSVSGIAGSERAVKVKSSLGDELAYWDYSGALFAPTLQVYNAMGVDAFAGTGNRLILSNPDGIFVTGGGNSVSGAYTFADAITLASTLTGASANFAGTVTFGIYTGQTSIVTLGTIATGVWNGTIITVPYGGTGVNTLASNGILYGNGSSPVNVLAVNSSATNKFLTQVSSGAPAWNTIVTGDINTLTNTWSNVQTFTSQPIFSSTSASLPLATDSSKGLVSITSSAILDLIGPTRGSLLYRGASGWAALIPGTSGYALTSSGTGADPSYTLIAGGVTGLANPTAQVGLAAVNGSATTAMRSDGAPALSQAISPTWTGTHIFSVVDNTANAWEVLQGSDVYINVRTSNASESIVFGNTSINPVYTFLGTGVTTIGGAVTGASSFTSLDDGSHVHFVATGAAATVRDLIRGQTAGSNRWIIRINADPESGGNAGSNLEILGRDDSGNALSVPLLIGRSTGNLTATGTYISDTPVTFIHFTASGLPGTVRDFMRVRSSGVDRWIFRVNADLETGSNAGSNWEVLARDDAGASLSIPLSIKRSTGAATFISPMGIGVTALTTTALAVSGALTTTGVTQYGIFSQNTFSSAATTSGQAGYYQLITAASAFTMVTGRGILIDTPSLGAGSAVTTVIGLDILTQTGGGTNLAIRTGASGAVQIGNLSASLPVATDASKNLISATVTGTGTTIVLSASPTLSGTIGGNLIWSGTQQFNTNIGVGVAPTSTAGFYIDGAITSGATQYGFIAQTMHSGESSSTQTQIIAAVQTPNTAFTLVNGYGARIADAIKGAASTITTLYGLRVDNQTKGSTNYSIWLGSGLYHYDTLTASQVVFTNSTKDLVSNPITGSGNVVMSASPTLTGTIGAASMTLSGTLQVTGIATFVNTSTKFSGASSTISMSTVDGSDNASLILAAGGVATNTRGAVISLYGNEVGGVPGCIELIAGAVTGGEIHFYVGGTKTFTVGQDFVNHFNTAAICDTTLNIVGITTSAAINASSTITVADPASNVYYVANGAAGTSRDLFRIQSAAVNRWIFRGTSTAESGSNAGTNFQILARDDAGASLSVPLEITRSNGQIDTIFAQVNTQSIGATSTDGYVLKNTTAAAAGAQQWSPRLHFNGRGWRTTSTAASRVVDWIEELQPVQGAANPSVNLVWSHQINNLGYVQSMSLNGDGTNTQLFLAGDFLLSTAGNGLYVKEGTNATMGTAVLVLGTKVVSTTKVTANSRIFLSSESLGTITSPVAVAVTARTAGTSFTITSANLTDTSTIAWIIIEPAP